MFGNKYIWGWLYPYQGSKKCRGLKGKSYVVGKDSGCDVVISKLQVSSDDYANLNKQHFKIKRKDNEVYLKDLSSMHTYVNGKELYFNEKIKLKHNDVISVLRHSFKVFVYLDNKCLEAEDYPDSIKNLYVISFSLSERKSAVTNLVFEKETCKRLVIKKLNNTGGNKTVEDIEKLRKLHHPCLLPIHNVHSTSDAVYVVTEHEEGGNLLSRIQPKKTLADDDIKLVLYQTALAMQYLHDNNVVHGNLKPENILLVSADSKSQVKVTDVSLSTRDKYNEPADTESPLYLSPELASLTNDTSRQRTSTQADVWALGVILFYCLSGSPPFKCSVRTSSEWSCSFLPSVWSRRSLAKDLVKTMLTPDPNERTTVDRALSHPWLKTDTIRSLAHSLMYPGEKYEPPDEEETPPSSPKQIFFEDVTIQRSKPPRNITEKFGVQVLPMGQISRKSTPEHIFRKNEKQKEFENHTFQKSSSFRLTGSVDNTYFRKSWSQRLPGPKPVPPTKPPRQSSDIHPQYVSPGAPSESNVLQSHPTATPPKPPAKPLRLFKQISIVESSESSNDPQQNSALISKEHVEDSSVPPLTSLNSSSEGMTHAVNHDGHAKPSNVHNLSQTSKTSDNQNSNTEQCVPTPVPSPRYKIPPTQQEHSDTQHRDTQEVETEYTTNSGIRLKPRNDVSHKQIRESQDFDGLSSHRQTKSEDKSPLTEMLLVAPRKPARTSLLNNGKLFGSDKPRNKRVAPKPPPKPPKSQNIS